MFPNDAGGLFAENPALATTGVDGFLVLRMILRTTVSGKDAIGTWYEIDPQSMTIAALLALFMHTSREYHRYC